MFKIKKSLCIVLSVIMLLGVLAVAPITVHAGMPFYFHPGVADSEEGFWYAWTWTEGEDNGSWREGEIYDDSTIEFWGLSDKVVFVLLSDEQSELNEDSWDYTVYQSDDIDVDYEYNHFTATEWTEYNDKWGTENFNGEWSDEEISVEPPEKAENSLSVSTSVKTVKARILKKSDKTLKPLTINDYDGTIKVIKVKSGTNSKIYKKITVNAKTGAIKIKKGTYKPGTYKIRLKITASGDEETASAKMTKTVKIKIKGKDKNPMILNVKGTKDVKISTLASSKKTYKMVSAKKAKGKVTFKKVKKGTTKSIYKNISVNKKTGAITFKKGSYAKGNYEISIKATTKGNVDYKAKSITATVKFRIANKFVKCKTCEGKGYVYTGQTLTLYFNGMPWKTIYYTRDCYDCDGTGKVVS